MEPKATTHEGQGTPDEREWELADEELDRSNHDPARFLCSTSRPCSCSRCHCR